MGRIAAWGRWDASSWRGARTGHISWTPRTRGGRNLIRTSDDEVARSCGCMRLSDATSVMFISSALSSYCESNQVPVQCEGGMGLSLTWRMRCTRTRQWSRCMHLAPLGARAGKKQGLATYNDEGSAILPNRRVPAYMRMRCYTRDIHWRGYACLVL